jgi:type IV pilus assembly protein PilE
MKLREIISSDRRSPGFTLVELMIALTIIAVLAAIAIPMYSKQVQKSRRVDARTAVTDLAGREERYLSTAGSYTNVAANLGYSALPVVVGSGYYTLSVNVPVVAAGVQPTYTVIATVVAGSTQIADGACQYFSVDNTGKQFSSATNAGGADTSTTCWN